jgi:hypothetical protein
VAKFHRFPREDSFRKARAIIFTEFMGEQSNLSIGHSSGDEPGKTKTVNAESSNAWYVNMNNGNVNTNNKTSAGRVRPVSATDKPIYDIPLSSIIEAYDDCCRQKRNTNDCIEFSFNYDTGLVAVWESIRYGHYEPGFSDCFMRKKPVLREVFAAAYIDRVVHHWIDLRLDPILEERFQAQGNVSKNCRIGEGCLSAVMRMDEMIKEVSKNYTQDAYIFKGDLKSFFMSMSKSLLWEMIDIFVRDNYKKDDIECLLYLLRVVIFHQPQKKCHRKSPLHLWDKLPKDKSLFYSSPERGVAIGNLPSQKFANFIGSVFDHYVTIICDIKHYVRFVDDFGFVMRFKEDILKNVPLLNDYLKEQLLLELHPKKIYIQHYSKGVLFVGAFILPNRIYISNRVVGNIYDAVSKYNKIAKEGFCEAHIETFVATMNSYYGLMRHFNTYNLRRKIGKIIAPEWWQYIYVEGHWEVFVIKSEYNFKKQVKKQIRKGNAKKYLTPEIS